MVPKRISLEALPSRLRFTKPDDRHPVYSISDRELKTYIEGSGILILEWNQKPEVDLELVGCSREIEFSLPASFWQVYTLAKGVRLHPEDLEDLSLNERQTVVLRNYFVSSEDLFFDYRLPAEAGNAAELQEVLSKCGSDVEKENMAVVVVVPMPDDETEFFFVESIEILNRQTTNEFARQPVLVIKAFGSPGWTAFDYPSEHPRATKVRIVDSSLTLQIAQPGMTSHATKPKVKTLKMQDPFF